MGMQLIVASLTRESAEWHLTAEAAGQPVRCLLPRQRPELVVILRGASVASSLCCLGRVDYGELSEASLANEVPATHLAMQR